MHLQKRGAVQTLFALYRVVRATAISCHLSRAIIWRKIGDTMDPFIFSVFFLALSVA